MREIVVGERFERLTVLAVGVFTKHGSRHARCVCTCGKVTTPRQANLLTGMTKSCGCINAELLRKSQFVGTGARRMPEYRVFIGMKGRCNQPTNKNYPNYGGRGVRVEYRNFAEFIADVGRRPEGGTIERKNTNGNYAPGNCLWVSTTENNQNQRTSKFWIIDGVSYASVREAARALGISTSTVLHRCNGWTDRKTGQYVQPLPNWTSQLKYGPLVAQATQLRDPS